MFFTSNLNFGRDFSLDIGPKCGSVALDVQDTIFTRVNLVIADLCPLEYL